MVELTRKPAPDGCTGFHIVCSPHDLEEELCRVNGKAPGIESFDHVSLVAQPEYHRSGAVAFLSGINGLAEGNLRRFIGFPV